MDQTEQQLAVLRSYGGADNTAASFLRPQYVRYNSVSKALDLGPLTGINAVISGVVGAECGCPTIFIRLETLVPARLGIAKGSFNRFIDATVSIGVVNETLDPQPLGDNGFVQPTASPGQAPGANEILPAGVYYFTVSSSRWQTQPFEVFITAISSRDLEGALSGALTISGRIALAKLNGAAGGSLDLLAAIPTGSALDLLSGAAGGTLSPVGLLAGLSGAAGGTLFLSGSFRTTVELSGVITGSAPLLGDLTAFAPY